MKRRGWIAVAFLALLLLGVAFPFVWRWRVETRYARDIVGVEDAVPTRVAIVFGARVYGDGRLSSMVRDRVDTAVELYNAGKVEKLLFSGDNRFADYNEPADMMTYAAQQGIPLTDMQPDYGGRRTYDTCYRAQSIFGVEEALLVTQAFHLPRALFTCSMLGVDVQGVAADRRTYAPASVQWSESREVPATFVALLDVVRRAPPPVMGDPIDIQ
jgi:SanA protein